MALDISGITNVGEFFSQHYLDTLLESDLKETLKRWATREKEDKVKAPPRRLAALADGYFRAAARAAGESDAAERWALTRDFHANLMAALGYSREPTLGLLDDGRVVPLLLSMKQGGRPYLWVLEIPFARDEDDADPLSEAPLLEQLGRHKADEDGEEDTEAGPELAQESWRELLDGPILRAEHPPRWVLVLAGSEACLVDRDKWHQGKYLRFSLGRLLGLRDPKALQAVCGLLHAEVLLPEGGQSVLERLDEQSHKHAFAVSTDLKFGAQKAIELLGNEAIRYRLSVSKQKTFNDGINVDDLTRECIVYLYRLLFLFYVEARGAELGVVPMQSDAYRLGYSLESLRDLELVPLTTDEARNGRFINDSLRQLFHLVQRGHGLGQLSMGPGEPLHETFVMRGLRSPLFDEERTPILRSVVFRNQVLQEVLQLLSLSKEGKGKSRGRISYAQLGINQLGAVYEGLLSYTGFFAQEELYEVRAASELNDPEARTYFVPASKIDDYQDTERVKDDRNRPVRHPKGTFLFRLSGREREKSASYYTPEVLTQCLTKYTLKVRLDEPLLPEESTPEQRAAQLGADEILQLTLCEPAMGSGAFLNEAVNQLAHKYLEKKQAELGQTIPAEEYQREWAKVKYHLVVHNSYGVDLNPLATELGKISLWLNVLQPQVEAPFLDLRLAVGNSLIGARREVYARHLLTAKPNSRNDSWLNSPPERVPLRDPSAPPGAQLCWPERPSGSVYHFLLPSSSMVSYADDKVVSELRPKEAERLRQWRAEHCRAFSSEELERLVASSDRIDLLWKRWAEHRIGLLNELRQPIQLWGQALDEAAKVGRPETHGRFASVEECEERVRGRAVRAEPGARLKWVMDYWVALWFWPVLEAYGAPTREQWLSDVEALLEGGVEAVHRLGEAAAQRLAVVERVAREQRGFHWELAFAEVFAQRGGMDVFLGNPPWVKVEWKEAGILGDLEPLLNLRKLSAKAVADKRREVVGASADVADEYLSELASAQEQGAYLSANANYPLLAGVKANLYKCFCERTTSLTSTAGTIGLLHPEGSYDDPKGGRARAALYKRLRLHAQLVNEKDLFPEIHNLVRYSLNVYGALQPPDFYSLSNLFLPQTVDASFEHDGLGEVPGIKTEQGEWDVRGHRSRIVRVNEQTLTLFAKLYDAEGTPPHEARLPVVHSKEILDVLRRFAEVPHTLSSLGDAYYCTQHFNETNHVKDGTMVRETRLPEGPHELILSGPHFYVGTPFNKTPNEGCRHNKDYSEIDLTVIADDYLPRTNYVPACSPAEYRKRTPHWNGKPVTEFYRYINRTMVAPTGERTLVPSVIPPGPAHIDLGFSVTFGCERTMLEFAGMASSLPVDFFVKSTGKGHARADIVSLLPLPVSSVAALLRHRALRLNCLTTHYADLWQRVVTADIAKDGFAKADPRLPSWKKLTPRWNRESALRTPFERRQALVELDALAALSLGLTLEQLLLIYRVQFPVLQQYERETYYDQRGKIVFTVNRGLSGVGVSRKQWEEIRDAAAGDTLPEWACDAQGPFVPPFDACDREADLAEAYRHFAARLKLDASED